MELTVTMIPGEWCPAATQSGSGPGGCRRPGGRSGGTLPAADFVAFLLAALHCGPGTGTPEGEAPAFGSVPAGVDGVPNPGDAEDNPGSGEAGRIAPSGAEVNTGVIPAGLNAKAGAPVGPAHPPALSAVENLSPASGTAEASRPGAAAGAVPGVLGGSAAAGSPPVGTGSVPESQIARNGAGAEVPPPASGERLVPPAAGVPEHASGAVNPLQVPVGPPAPAPGGIPEHAAAILAQESVCIDAGQGLVVPRAANVLAEPEPRGFPGRAPEGTRQGDSLPRAQRGLSPLGMSPLPTPGTPGGEPPAREAQPSGHGAAENRPGGVPAGLDPAPGVGRSDSGATVPNDREPRGHIPFAGVRAETVPERAAPVRILPAALGDGPKLWFAALRAEAATGRPGPDGAPETVRAATPDRGVVHALADRQVPGQPQPQMAPAAATAPAARVPALAPAFVPEPAGSPAVSDRQVPAQGTGQGVPDVSPPGMRPPAQLDPYPVARQLAEAVVHHVRQLQVQAGQAVRVSIALEPPELGRVTMKLTFGRLGLEVLFYTADRSVKAVIEQALPQLREALARQEINVGNTTVFLGHEEAQDQAPRFFHGPWPGWGAPGEPADEQSDSGRQAEPRRSGVDYLV